MVVSREAHIDISITGVPVIQSIEILPNPAYTDSNLQALAETYDADGDEIVLTYEWHVNTDDVHNTVTFTLSSSYFQKGDNVYVIATPSDAFSTENP